MDKSPKCLSQFSLITLGTISWKEIFYIYCEFPSSRCCLNARSCLKDFYNVQFPISKSSMVWKIRKRVSESVSGLLSQKPLTVQHCAGASPEAALLETTLFHKPFRVVIQPLYSENLWMLSHPKFVSGQQFQTSFDLRENK